MHSVPPVVRRFLVLATVIFIGWKALYLLILQPANWPDRQLVDMITDQTLWVLNGGEMTGNYTSERFLFQHTGLQANTADDYEGYMSRIFFKGDSLLLIVRSCNGLELMALYAGFIVAFIGRWQNKLAFISAGIVGIHLVNVLRCTLLIRMANSSYQRFFNFTHHYLFTISIYAFIFWLWMIYVKQTRQYETT